MTEDVMYLSALSARDKPARPDAFPHIASYRRSRITGLAILALCLLGLMAAPRSALAACWFTQGRARTITFNAHTIILPSGMTPGTAIWTSPIETPTDSSITCDSTTNSGLANTLAGGPTGSDNTLFPTNVPGISFRILHPDNSLRLPTYPHYQVASGDYSVTVNSALQLVFTGPSLPPDGSVLSGHLGDWNMDLCEHSNCRYWSGGHWRYENPTPSPIARFTTGAITFVSPSCSVAVDPTVVTLPNVMASQFTGPGSHPGDTSFQVKLSCPQSASGRHVSITLDSNDKIAGDHGVIKPAQGSSYAQGVGVQILDGNGDQIDFGTAISIGNVNTGNFNIPLRAHYYQTGATVSGGQVEATATYTLTYQ